MHENNHFLPNHPNIFNRPQSQPTMADHFARICQNLTRFLPDQFPVIHKNSDKKSVLVESRNLVHIEFVIKNTILKLGEGWGHMVFCSQKNYSRIKSICSSISPEIEIILLDEDIQNVNQYNNLCLDPAFWEQIQCKKALIYQTDTFIFKDFDHSFLEYDYIGAPWGPGLHTQFVAERIGIQDLFHGNGGLSLRNVDLVKKALADQNFQGLMHHTAMNPGMNKIPEDVFFAIYIAKNGIFPGVETAMTFSFEYSFDFKLNLDLSEDSFGCHKIQDFFSNEKDMESYLESHFYKRMISSNQLKMDIEKDILGYIHVACMGDHWLQVFNELLDSIISGGLYENSSAIHICVSGQEETFIQLKTQFPQLEKLEWTWNGNVIDHFEYPTLDLLHQNASNPHSHKIWYAHTKGVTHDLNQPYYKYWRKALIQSNLTEWKKHYLALDEHDTSGESWVVDPQFPQHYSGNFWWANSDFISQLENIWHFWENPREDWTWHIVKHDRWQPEMWLSTKKLNPKNFGIYDPIRFKDLTGAGYSHFIFHRELDPFDCLLNQIAEKKYLINLQERTDRIFKCNLEFEKIGLENVVRWNAVNARKFNLTFPQQHFANMVRGEQMEGGIGCWLSHFNVIESAERDDLETVLIMEDDVAFTHGFNELFSYYFPLVPDDWEMIWIGSVERFGNYKTLINEFIAVPHDPWGLHCYLLNRKGIRKILENLREGIKEQVDIQITRMTKDLKQYEIIPSLAYQRESSSDIQKFAHNFYQKVVFKK